jgi:hypothetical protein
LTGRNGNGHPWVGQSKAPRSVRRLHGHRPLIPTVERRSGSGHLSPAQGVRPSGCAREIRRFGGRATPWSAKALTREVAVSRRLGAGVPERAPLARCRAYRRAQAPRTKGGARWTLIVRAEVGPFRRCPCQSLAHADAAPPPPRCGEAASPQTVLWPIRGQNGFIRFCNLGDAGLPTRVPQSRFSAKRERGEPP